MKKLEKLETLLNEVLGGVFFNLYKFRDQEITLEVTPDNLIG